MRDDEFPPCCTSCGEMIPQVQNLQAIIHDLEKDLRVKRAQNSRLKGERNDQQQLSPFADQAREWFDHWNTVCRDGNAKEFSGARFDLTVDRLTAGFTFEEWQQACERARRLLKGEVKHTLRSVHTFTEMSSMLKDEPTLTRFIQEAQEPLKPVPVEQPRLTLVKPDPMSDLCDCGHEQRDHIPPRLLVEREELQLVVPAGHSPCAHADCDCVDFDRFHQAADEWLERERERLLRARERERRGGPVELRGRTA